MSSSSGAASFIDAPFFATPQGSAAGKVIQQKQEGAGGLSSPPGTSCVLLASPIGRCMNTANSQQCMRRPTNRSI
jgi:hypothetical protein